MAIRGLYGLRKNGQDKLTYNHFDSEPDCLGRKILKLCCDSSADDLDKLYDLIELVGADKPTEKQINICKKNGYANFDIGSHKEDDWYCLLFNLQGNIDALSKAIYRNQYVFMTDSHKFILNSLFCEHAYIINLDTKSLEYYVGFMEEPQKGNRYGEIPNEEGYYPCKLIMNIPLNSIKYKSIDKYIDEMNKRTEE